MNNNTKKKPEDTVDYSQQKPWAFLIIYFIFFTVLIMSIRSYNKNTPEKEPEKTFDFSFSEIEKNNYNFEYDLDFDSNQVTYIGKRNKERSLFQLNANGNSESFFESSGLYVKNMNSYWQKVDCPYQIEELTKIKYLKKLLQKATYDAKTSYESGNTVYIYQISTTTVEKIFSGKDIDLGDDPNKISITFNNNDKKVTKIEYDFTPYAVYKNIATKTYQFTMNYSNFGEVEELNI